LSFLSSGLGASFLLERAISEPGTAKEAAVAAPTLRNERLENSFFIIENYYMFELSFN
jgi:hypothetical protein